MGYSLKHVNREFKSIVLKKAEKIMQKVGSVLLLEGNVAFNTMRKNAPMWRGNLKHNSRIDYLTDLGDDVKSRVTISFNEPYAKIQDNARMWGMSKVLHHAFAGERVLPLTTAASWNEYMKQYNYANANNKTESGIPWVQRDSNYVTNVYRDLKKNLAKNINKKLRG